MHLMVTQSSADGELVESTCKRKQRQAKCQQEHFLNPESLVCCGGRFIGNSQRKYKFAASAQANRVVGCKRRLGF